MKMYAIKVNNLFGQGWKKGDVEWVANGKQLIWGGDLYIPLDEVMKHNLILKAQDIEVLEIK